MCGRMDRMKGENRQRKRGRERSLSVCARDVLESRVSASRVFHVICSQAFPTLSFTLWLSLLLSLFILLDKLPFHVTCRSHIKCLILKRLLGFYEPRLYFVYIWRCFYAHIKVLILMKMWLENILHALCAILSFSLFY